MFYVGTDGNCYKLKTTNSSELILATQQLNTKVNLFEKPLSKTISDVRNCHTGYDPYNGEWWIQLDDLSLIYNYQLTAISSCVELPDAKPPVSQTIPSPRLVSTIEPLGWTFRLAATIT